MLLIIMTKTIIIVIMEELVAIKIVTVIIMSYSQNSAEIKKNDLTKKLGR